MEKNYIKLALFMMCVLLLFGCAAQKPQPMFQPYDFSPMLQAGRYVPKVDNFLVVFDASGSMADPFEGKAKIELAKEIVNRMNHTIPDMEITGGLRTFGDSFFCKKTTLVYGLSAHSRQGLDNALQAVKRASGGSPMAMALDAAGKDLQSVEGKTALIIVSDGKEMDEAPVFSAKKIKDQFNDMICIYTIQIGDDLKGKSLMERIAKIGPCGFSAAANQIYSSKNMANFVETVFLTKAAKPVDTDGDGVTDDRDRCPDTPGGVKVDRQGCPLDTDGDGVYDYLDKCPGTPVGAKVDARGCWVLKGLRFDTGKSSIKPLSFPILDEVVTIMKKNPHLKVEVQGHTDNRGAEQYNQRLSEDRARSVMEYLMDKGIEKNRLTSIGYGFSKPAASNLTEEGRAQNRRVELKPTQ